MESSYTTSLRNQAASDFPPCTLILAFLRTVLSLGKTGSKRAKITRICFPGFLTTAESCHTRDGLEKRPRLFVSCSRGERGAGSSRPRVFFIPASVLGQKFRSAFARPLSFRAKERLEQVLPIALRLSNALEAPNLRLIAVSFLHFLFDISSPVVSMHFVLPQLLFLADEDLDPAVRCCALRHVAAVRSPDGGDTEPNVSSLSAAFVWFAFSSALGLYFAICGRVSARTYVSVYTAMRRCEGLLRVLFEASEPCKRRRRMGVGLG